MCGICGVALADRSAEVPREMIERMNYVIHHRGPDDSGIYARGPVAIGHRRLSIVDLSGGHQPMANEDNTVWVAYNGEIYNHAIHRAPLEAKGHVFKTRSDTEAIIHLYEDRGARAPQAMRGMFAFAIWDENKETLLLARDRSGIKPLFYAVTPSGDIAFGSEIKAVLASGLVEAAMDEDAVAEYFALGTLAGDRTLYRNVKKLLPGHTLTWRAGTVRIERYWDLPEYRERRP